MPALAKAGDGSVLSHLHCSEAERRKNDTPVLFLQLILVFMAFDFMRCFGLALPLSFLPLLSHSEPGCLPSQVDGAGLGTPSAGVPVPQLSGGPGAP